MPRRRSRGAARRRSCRPRSWQGPLTSKVISAGASSDMLGRVTSGATGRQRRMAAGRRLGPVQPLGGRHVVASQPAAYFPVGPGSQRRSHAVGIYDIGRYLHAGRDLLLVHVYGDQARGALPRRRHGRAPRDRCTSRRAPAGMPPPPAGHRRPGRRAGRRRAGPLSRVWPAGSREPGSPGLGVSAALARRASTQTRPRCFRGPGATSLITPWWAWRSCWCCGCGRPRGRPPGAAPARACSPRRRRRPPARAGRRRRVATSPGCPTGCRPGRYIPAVFWAGGGDPGRRQAQRLLRLGGDIPGMARLAERGCRGSGGASRAPCRHPAMAPPRRTAAAPPR